MLRMGAMRRTSSFLAFGCFLITCINRRPGYGRAAALLATWLVAFRLWIETEGIRVWAASQYAMLSGDSHGSCLMLWFPTLRHLAPVPTSKATPWVAQLFFRS